MQLENLPNHYLDVLVERHVIGSRLRLTGRSRQGMACYVRIGPSQDTDQVPEWSSDADMGERLRLLYVSRGRPLTGTTPKELVIEALRKEGL